MAFCSVKYFQQENVISCHMKTKLIVQNILDVCINAKYIGCCIGVTKIPHTLLKVWLIRVFEKRAHNHQQFSEIGV